MTKLSPLKVYPKCRLLPGIIKVKLCDLLNQSEEHLVLFEPGHSDSNKITCTPNEVADQPAHLRRLIRIFDVRLTMLRLLGYTQSAT